MTTARPIKKAKKASKKSALKTMQVAEPTVASTRLRSYTGEALAAVLEA